jgi:hypothetical protein
MVKHKDRFIVVKAQNKKMNGFYFILEIRQDLQD